MQLPVAPLPLLPYRAIATGRIGAAGRPACAAPAQVSRDGGVRRRRLPVFAALTALLHPRLARSFAG